MNWIFLPPSSNDLIRLLKAWRFWILATLVGAVIGAIAYAVAPPPFRARATVNVDFNLEVAWPEETDRQQFYYLEREARKLEEIAWSDGVLDQVARETGIPIAELRNRSLMLSQPAEAGWHFYADHRDPDLAAWMATSWAQAFVVRAGLAIESQPGMSSYTIIEATQVADVPITRRLPQSVYLMIGSTLALAFGAVFFLFARPGKQP